MQFSQFQKILTPPRISRYLAAAANDTKKSMTLYRHNLKVSQELFTIVSCFEVALRNAIDEHYVATFGVDWLKAAAAPGGIFDNPDCETSQKTINDAIRDLRTYYAHSKLVAELGFGFWRYMFGSHQFIAGGQSLLAIFPSKPPSSPMKHYNANLIFNDLAQVNRIRNRIAHHEPICFRANVAVKDTTYVRQNYSLIKQLFQWMNIDEAALLYGLDHIGSVCDKIDML
jgi:hypothetical protein